MAPLRLSHGPALLLTLAVLQLQAEDMSGSHRIAVAFYGVPRSIQYTLPSINRHIFGVLSKHGTKHDIFWHGLSTDSVNMSDYVAAAKSMGDIIGKQPRLTVSDQMDVIEKDFPMYCKARSISYQMVGRGLIVPSNEKDIHKDTFLSVKNILCAMHALHVLADEISSYANNHGIRYDGILVLRPDTAVIGDIDIPLYISEISEASKKGQKKLWLPMYKRVQGYNDRIAYGSLNAMRVYMQRGPAYRDRNWMSNDEMFLQKYLPDMGVMVHESQVRVIRIREGGLIHYIDTKIYHLLGPKDIEKNMIRCIKNASDHGGLDYFHKKYARKKKYYIDVERC